MSLGEQCLQLDVALQRAIGHHQAGRMPEAERFYRGILQAEPHCPDANHNLGILMLQKGQVESGLPYLKTALEGSPEKGQYWLSYAESLLAARNASDALAVLQQAKQCGLSGAAVDTLMSRAEKAVRSDVSDSHRPNFHISVDKQGFKVKPDFAEAHNEFGKTLVRLDKLDAAISSYERALALRPDFAEAHSNRGEALRRQGRLEEAQAACRRAIAISPNYAKAHVNLGKILWDSNRIKEGCESFTRSAELTYGVPSCEAASDEPIPPHKLRHDQDQRDYLASIGIGRAAAGEIFHLAEGDELAQPALNPGNTTGDVAARWQRSSPKIVVIDDFLTNEALDRLRRFCWGSTLWRRVYQSGDLGAFPEFGFACPLLAQIAEELRCKYPTVFASHPLTQLWAFKYETQLSGIGLHADFAAINVNFWITPDDANLDPNSGGLVIWDKSAPLDWDFAKYNTDPLAALEFLAHTGAHSVTVPYRSNRAVIFDSDLFHETDGVKFKEGYLNRRISVTLLYGRREKATDS